MLEPTGFARPKPLIVLAYLALEGPTERSRLRDLFFATAADPADSLSTTLRRLSRLPGALTSNDGTVATTVACDATGVLRRLDDGDHVGACQAYTGRFLGDPVPGLPAEGEEWVFAAREFIAHRVIDAHLHVGERGLCDEDDGVVAREHATAAYQLAKDEDLEPEVLARLYHLMHRSGHPRAEQLLELVRRGQPAVPTAATSSPPTDASLGPPPAAQLVDREAELDAVVQALTSGESRLVTLHGQGGVGKTRLAQEIVRATPIELAFGPDRTFLALEDVTTPEAVPSMIAKAAGLRIRHEADPWQALAYAIGNSRRLLVLDAWERLRAASPRLLDVLERCTGLHLLVTSRVRLGMSQEWSLTLKGLEVPDAHTGASPRDAGSMRMFVQQARRHDLAFELRDQDVTAAARICRAVDGLPLGLALAAAWTRSVPLARLADDLEHDIIALGNTTADASDRHATLARAVESSWLALEHRQRDVLRRLSICHGFRREAAAAIAGASIADLVGLMDRSWLTATADGRFVQHEVLRRFAELELEAEPTTRETALKAHEQHYRHVLLERAQGGRAAPAALAALYEEEGNLAACLVNTAARGDAEAITSLVEPLHWYFSVQGRFRDGDSLFARTIQQLDEDDPRFRGALSGLYTARAWFCRYAGDIRDALAYSRRAVALADASASDRARGSAHEVLGQVEMLTGDNEDALTHLQTGHDIAARIGDEALKLRAMEKIVHVRTALGDFEGAATVVDEALQIIQQGRVPMSMDVVAMFFAVGFNHLASKAWLRARDGFLQGLAMAQEHDLAGPEVLFEVGIGMAEVGQGIEAGDSDLVASGAARSRWALPPAKERGESLSLVFLHGSLGRAAMSAGELDEAAKHLREGLRHAWEQGNRTAGMWITPWLAELYVLDGRQAAAAELAAAVIAERATPAWVRDHLREVSSIGASRGPSATPAGPPVGIDALVEALLAGE